MLGPRGGIVAAMPIFSGGGGGLQRLVCPHCGKVQARGKAPELKAFACKQCGKSFSREEGLKAARDKEASRHFVKGK